MSPNNSQSADCRVLIIDDDPEITDLISEIAKESGYVAQSINNSDEISNGYANFNPQGVFLDLDLGDRDGVEVMHYLSIAECNAKIFIMSGMGEEVLENSRMIGQQMNLDVAGILPKPFTVENVQKLLHTL